MWCRLKSTAAVAVAFLEAKVFREEDVVSKANKLGQQSLVDIATLFSSNVLGTNSLVGIDVPLNLTFR